MNLRCIVLKISAGVFFASGVFSQSFTVDTVAFYRHLGNEQLFAEKILFAQRFQDHQPARDTFLLDMAACYVKLKRMDSCRSVLTRIGTGQAFSERQNELFMSVLILTHELDLAEKRITLIRPGAFADARPSVAMLKRQRADTSSKDLSPRISDIVRRYNQAPSHSAFLAGGLSSILPGAGKWYAGSKRQALTAFLASALLAVQAAEVYRKAGPESAQFIAAGGLFGVFYIGNIWGSVSLVKKKKRDYLKQLDYEILDYYHHEFTRLAR